MIKPYYAGRGVTLYCGDAISILPKIKDKFDACITDPPYFVLPNGRANDRFVWDYFDSEKEFFAFTKKWMRRVDAKLNERSCKFVFWSQKYLNDGVRLFKPSRLCFWHHSNLITLGRAGDFAYDYEPLLVVWNGEPMLRSGAFSCFFNCVKPQSNFYGEQKLFHPAQKPVELMCQLLFALDSAQTIIDPFAGSGTTGVACVKFGRKCVLIEKNEKYCELAARRIENTPPQQSFLF